LLTKKIKKQKKVYDGRHVDPFGQPHQVQEKRLSKKSRIAPPQHLQATSVGRSASIDMQSDLMQSLASTRHNSKEITSGELHGPWAPQEARMLHSLPNKQAGVDETIQSLEILAYNDFVAVSSRIGHGYMCPHMAMYVVSYDCIFVLIRSQK
jgi:hypothetical protein